MKLKGDIPWNKKSPYHWVWEGFAGTWTIKKYISQDGYSVTRPGLSDAGSWPYPNGHLFETAEAAAAAQQNYLESALTSLLVESSPADAGEKASEKSLAGALEGCVNWMAVAEEVIHNTSCDPDDEEAFEDAMRGLQMFRVAGEKVLEAYKTGIAQD